MVLASVSYITHRLNVLLFFENKMKIMKNEKIY